MSLILKILGILFIVVLVVFLLYMLAIMPHMLHRPNMEAFMHRLYAHRGLHNNQSDAPENSMLAFEKAVQRNYGIELDVQLTKDDEVVVCHDFDLKRICGKDIKIKDLTFEELQQYPIYGSSQTIPKFTDVLALVDGKVPLIIEYKSEDTNMHICDRVESILQEYTGVYCVESFNPMIVFWYRKHRKETVRGILSDSYVKEGFTAFPKIGYELMHHLLLNFIIKPDFVAYNHLYYKDISRTLCHKLYRLPAVAWTIKSKQQLSNRQKDFDLFIFDSFDPEE